MIKTGNIFYWAAATLQMTTLLTRCDDNKETK